MSKFSSYLRGLRNDLKTKNDNEIELEGKKSTDSDNEALLPAENHSKSRFISKNLDKLDDSIEEIKKSLEDHHAILFTVNQTFKRFEREHFEELTEILHDNQAIAFQDESFGTFCIAWRKSKDEFFAVNIFERNNIDKEDLLSLCSYILEFLCECFEKNHSGLFNPNNIPADKFNIDLPLLTDSNGLNLLFHAAFNGNSKIVPILLQVAFIVNMMHNRHLVCDFASRNEHYETVLVLLKNNAFFPVGFNVEKCQNDELKAFVKMSQEFHDHIKSSNMEEMIKILSENPNLRYFYNTLNQSASAVALFNKKFEIYELLLKSNLFLSFWEDIDDLTERLNDEEKEEIREIHFRNKKDIHQPHLTELLQKCSVGHDDEKVTERLNHVMRAFQELNKFPLIEILLKIAALLSNLQIIFDFNRDSIEYLDPTQNRSTLGLFYFNGRVYVGAKQLLNSLREHEVLATIAHELCHFVLYSIFNNKAKPYKESDNETKTEFEEISNDCESKNEIDDIISAVYDYYPQNMVHAELIVRIPHFYAHYCKQSETIKRLKIEFKLLFDFYEFKLLPKLEESLNELKAEAAKKVEEVKELKEKIPKMETKIDLLESKRKEKNKKISRLTKALMIGFIIMIFVGIYVRVWVYQPFYEWSKLDKEQKSKVYNGKVKFEGVYAKFSEIYGPNETANEVFGKLRSDHINLLINDGILDLNKIHNKVLQDNIFLVYQNLTENLKEKVKNSTIDFQGQPVVINSLLINKTEEILKTLNSTQIIDLIRNQKSVKIGKEIKISTKFHIERSFSQKHGSWYSRGMDSHDFMNELKIKNVILLSDDAGTGKTTSFKHLALEWKEKYPLEWVQYVDLKAKIKIYQKYHNEISNLTEVLIEIFDIDINFSIEVFKVLYKNHNVVILWDGFDEISPTYSNFMLKLMTNIKNETQNIQFISSRPHYENSIKEILNCAVYSLESLTENDNERFLNKFYKLKNLTTNQIVKAKETVKKLTAKVQFDQDVYKPEDYVESPLMLEMIAEVSINDEDTFDTINLYTIYDNFIDERINLTDYKGDVVKDERNKNQRKGLNLDENFQYFAVKSFEYDLEIIHRYENKTLNIDILSRYGILIFNSIGFGEFVHRTFQEFYLAQYYVQNLYNFEEKTNCNEISKKFEIIIKYIILSRELKVKEFLSGYSSVYESEKNDQNFIFCFKNHSKLIRSFHKMFFKIKQNNFERFLRNLNVFPFKNEFIEILWHIDTNKTFLNELASLKPQMFVDNLEMIQRILTKYFPDDQDKQKQFLFSKNQRGSFLYAIYNDDKKLSIDKHLLNLNFLFDIDLNKLRNICKVFEFYEFVKPHLTDNEIREMLKTNFIDILVKDGAKIWSEIESKFSREEIQNLIYSSKLEDRPLLYYIKDFALIKLIFKTLNSKPDSRFFKFIQIDQELLLRKDSIMDEDNFEVIWKVISNQTSKNQKENILEFYLLDDQKPYRFNLFSASIEYGTVEKFSFVKNIYKQHFNSNQRMEYFCKQYLEIERPPGDSSKPNAETLQTFMGFKETLSTSKTIKPQVDKLVTYKNFNSGNNIMKVLHQG